MLPTAEWAGYLAGRDPTEGSRAVRTRGYRASPWEPLTSLRQLALELPERFSLPSRVVRAGECPNATRVYFALTTNAPSDPNARRPVGTIFGRPCELSRLQAGTTWDRHVTRANRALNRRLTRLTVPFTNRQIPLDSLRDYYNSQLVRISEITARHQVNNESLTIRIKPVLQRKRQTVGLERCKPDGMWLARDQTPQAGGLFESKLSSPPEPYLRRSLAAYALLAEQRFELDFDRAIMLTWDEGELRPQPSEITIGEVDRQSCLGNLARFRELIALRMASRSRFQRRRASPSWREFLVRPPRPPMAPECRTCEFRRQCRDPAEIDDRPA